MSKRQPYDRATPYYGEKKLSEIEALRAENARLQAELAEYKRNGIVDVTGSINYHSGYDDGFRAARNATGETE